MMTKHTTRGWVLSLVTCVCLCGSATAARAQGYTIIDLGTLGTPHAYAEAINNIGQVVGCAVPADSPWSSDTIPFRWTEGVGMEDLGSLHESERCYAWRAARAINDSGQAAGCSRYAFRYTDGVGMENLGTLGADHSQAAGINNHGDVVGGSYTGETYRLDHAGGYTLFDIYHAFWYTDALGIQDIGSLGGLWSSAWDINDAGAIVGYAETALPAGPLDRPGVGTIESRAFRYTAAGGMEDLGTLGGPNSTALAINELGQIVGTADSGPPCPLADASGTAPARAFIYTDAASIQGITPEIDPLALTDGFHVLTAGWACDINYSGQAVGLSRLNRYNADWTSAGSESYSFLWSVEGGLVNLDELVFAGTDWESVWVAGINNAGQICGSGYIGDECHPFRLDPIRLPGDGNLDGQVDGLDYILWSSNYGHKPASWGDGDFNLDNTVDGLDYIIWSSNFEPDVTPGGAVPEPAALSLLVLGALALLRHQNRPSGQRKASRSRAG